MVVGDPPFPCIEEGKHSNRNNTTDTGRKGSWKGEKGRNGRGEKERKVKVSKEEGKGQTIEEKITHEIMLVKQEIIEDDLL